MKIVNKSKHQLPSYSTEKSAGMDLRANLDENINVILKPNQRIAISTGIHIQLENGYEAQVRPRSGLSLKTGLVAILGTIDADYIGEVKVIIHNISDETLEVEDGDRIAQMVVSKYEKVEWDLVEELIKTERGENGFGSSGLK